MKQLTYIHAGLVGFNKLPSYDRVFPSKKETKKIQTPEEMIAVMSSINT